MSITVLPIRVTQNVFINYTYLLFDSESGEGILIDPSFDLVKVTHAVQSKNVKLTKILLTHSHFDHVNLADSLSKTLDIKVYISEIEAGSYGFCCNNIFLIDSNTKITLGNEQILPIFTPGHTKGSVCYLAGENLFTGDTLFIEGCGLCNEGEESLIAMFNSLQLLKRIIKNNTRIFAGHSYGEPPGKEFGYILQNNIYLMIDEIVQFVNFRTRKEQKNLFLFR